MRLEILIGPEDGRIVEVNLDREFTIGRIAGKNDLSFPYANAVTGQHGKLIRDGNKVKFWDTGNDSKGSKNGTKIKRGENVIELNGKDHELRSGDILIIGKCLWMRVLD